MKHLLCLALALLTACRPTPDLPVRVSYDGTKAGFTKFVEIMQRADWPIPATIDWFITADGTRLRYAHWPAQRPDKPAGTVVFFSGRTEFIEKNIYTYRDLQASNYDVWTLDWRGQGLSGRQLPENPDLGHINSFQTYLADAEQFVRQLVQIDRRPAGQRILLAHSMGGAIGAAYLQKHPSHFDKAVFSAPMMGLPQLLFNPLTRHLITAKATTESGKRSCMGAGIGNCDWQRNLQPALRVCDLRQGTRASDFKSAWRARGYSHDWNKLREAMCLIEASRAASSQATLGIGRPTAGWLQAALTAMDINLTAAVRLRTPLLIVSAGADRVVSNAAQQQFCARSASCCFHQIPGSSHEILIEREPERQQFMALFRRFAQSGDPPSPLCSHPQERIPALPALR